MVILAQLHANVNQVNNTGSNVIDKSRGPKDKANSSPLMIIARQFVSIVMIVNRL